LDNYFWSIHDCSSDSNGIEGKAKSRYMALEGGT
jgi:hypothetical protein